MVGKTVCPHCFKSFPGYGKRRLQKHIKHAHETFRPFLCRECGKSFRSNPLTKGHPHHKTHPNISLPDPKIKGTSTFCTECGKSYKSIKILKIHMLKFHPYLDVQQLFLKPLKEKPFICTECNASFTTNGSRNEHTRVIHNIENSLNKQRGRDRTKNVSENREIQTNQSLLIGLVFESTKTKIKTDKNYQIKEMSEKLEIASDKKENETTVIHSIVESETEASGMSETDGIPKAEQNTNSTNLYICEFCCKMFRPASRMKAHMISHSGERPHTCEACGKSFKEEIKLKTHMLSHDGKRSHTCEACGKSFTLKHTLKAHLKSHTGEKPYKCADCDKSFAFNDSRGLKGHMRIHASVKPHKCEICSFRSASVANLKRHMVKHNEEKPYKCTQCDYSCKTKPYLKSHLRIHRQSWNKRQYNRSRPLGK